jgi:hypothetical protein
MNTMFTTENQVFHKCKLVCCPESDQVSLPLPLWSKPFLADYNSHGKHIRIFNKQKKSDFPPLDSIIVSTAAPTIDGN